MGMLVEKTSGGRYRTPSSAPWTEQGYLGQHHCNPLLVLKAKVHSASIMDWDGIKMLLRQADAQFPRLKHLWLDSAYRGEGKGKDWVQKTLGWSVQLVERPRKPAPEEVLKMWEEEWTK